MAQTFWDRLIGSIGGVLIGLVIFIVSFVVLFNTEGRTDYSKVAEKAVGAGQSAAEDSFVYATGELKTDAPVGDDYLVAGNYAALRRNVETYAWEEDVETDENDVKYYTYDTVWVKEPADSNEFNDKRGHENYPPEIKDLDVYAENAFVGEYEIDPKKVRWPGYEKVSLKEDMFVLDDFSQVADDFLFRGYGTLQEPEVGDIRINWSAVTPGEKATVFGRPDGKKMEAHHGENEKGLYRVFWGTNDDAVSVLKNEYKTAGWTWRIIGFFIMWMGLMLIFNPLSVAFEALPLVSKLGKSAVMAITFLAALILTTVTTTVSMVLHNPFGIAAIVIAVVGAAYFVMMKKQQSASKSGINETPAGKS